MGKLIDRSDFFRGLLFENKFLKVANVDELTTVIEQKELENEVRETLANLESSPKFNCLRHPTLAPSVHSNPIIGHWLEIRDGLERYRHGNHTLRDKFLMDLAIERKQILIANSRWLLNRFHEVSILYNFAPSPLKINAIVDSRIRIYKRAIDLFSRLK